MPVFLLEDQEGRMFHPLALTKTFAVAVATLLAITLVPVLMAMLLVGSRPIHAQASRIPSTRFCAGVYEPVLRLALRWKWAFLGVNAAVVPLTGLLLFMLGPRVHAAALRRHDPVHAVGAAGPVDHRGDAAPAAAGSHAAGVSGGRAGVRDGRTRHDGDRQFAAWEWSTPTVTLKPRDQWRPGMTFEALAGGDGSGLQFPGFSNVWTQPIRGRLDMLSTGIKTPVGIKILGSDLSVIQELGLRIERILRRRAGHP